MPLESLPTAESSPRWSLERRLAFIASRLSWERRINRADIVARFGVSPNQATGDLRKFAAFHPGALVYDTRAKVYRAGSAWIRPDASDASALLRDLRLVAEGVLTSDATALAAPMSLALAEPPFRAASANIVAAVVAAARGGRTIEALYQSFSTPTPRRRRLEPHAMVFDGFRWHTRARDAEDGQFKDFVLGRLSEPSDAGLATISAASDLDWHTWIALDVRPHPGLSPAQRAAVEADYGMVDGRLRLSCRAAVANYLKRRLGLIHGHEGRRPEDQHIVLAPG